MKTQSKDVVMSNKYSLIVSFLIVLFSFACTRKSDEKKIIKDNSYFPLAVGNYWKYREYPGYGKFGYDISETRVTDTIRVKDTLFYKIIYPYTREKLEWYLYKDPEDNIWAKDSLSGPLTLYQKKLTRKLDYIDLLEGKDSVKMNFISEDTIEVPAGTFECLKFKLTFLCDTATPSYMWYSKGVGLVKTWFEIEDNREGGDILIEARVNGVKYP